MTPAEEKRLDRIDNAIGRIKNQLTEKSLFLSDHRMEKEIMRLGKLLVKKSELTGKQEDAPFIYVNDGKGITLADGFLGDLSGKTDCHGIPLLIGDTVGVVCSDGRRYAEIVTLSMPTQERIDKGKGIFVKNYSEYDLDDASCEYFSTALRYPAEEYEQSQQQGMEITL